MRARPSRAVASRQIDHGRVAGFRSSRHYLRVRAAAGSQLEVASRICGLHAQVMSSADLSLWARVRGHALGYLRRALWTERTLVKTWLMRGTLHVVPAEDLPLYVAVLDNRGKYSSGWLEYFEISAVEMERLIEDVAVALDGRCLTRRELTEALRERANPKVLMQLGSGWGTFLKPAARRGRLCFGPSQGQNVTFARPDKWLPRWRVVDPEEASAELLRRYLRVNGPATREDFEGWIGLPAGRLRPIWAAVADELEELEPKRFILRDDVRQLSSARIADSVRLLPAFDPFLMSHRDRVHFIAKEHRDRVYRIAGWVSPVVLQGGRVIGVWNLARKGPRVQVNVEGLARLSPRARDAIESEAALLAGYLGGELELRFTGT